MSRIRLFFYLSVALLVPVASTFVTASTLHAEPDDKGTLSIIFENDLFGGGTDRHFTHGTKITYTTREYEAGSHAVISDIAQYVPFFPENARTRASYSLGQSIFTPEDTESRALIRNDRPYAGWLYVGGGLIAADPQAMRTDALEVEIGIVGPASLAEHTQREWHRLLGIPVPEGWDNQIENEPGIVILYERTQQVWESTVPLDLKADFVPNAGFALGNVFTYASAGFTMRLGRDLTTDLGPPRIRPSLPGSNYLKPTDGFNWYLFTSFGGRAVARNIFLDGNTFTDSHNVDKKTFVGDFQAGLAIQYANTRLAITHIVRSPEFDEQDTIDRFGAITRSYRF